MSGRYFRRFICVVCAVLTFFSVNISLKAEEYFKVSYSSRRYTVIDGLPEALCWGIFQDSKGFIWAATYGGFACYDGQKFTPFWEQNEVNVLDVTESLAGKICALTFWDYAAIPHFGDSLRLSPKQRQWRLITHAGRNLPPGYAFFEDRKAKETALLALSDSGLVMVWKNELLSKMDFFRKPYWDQTNKLFYLPTNEKIYLFDEEDNMHDSIAVEDAHCIIPDKNIFWIVAPAGIYQYAEKKVKKVCSHSFSFDEMVGLNALVDQDGNLIINADDKVFRFDGRRLETIFQGVPVFETLLDREGSLWLATYDGIYNLFRLQFKNYVLTDENDMTRSILSDPETGIWAATMNGNLYKIEPDRELRENNSAIREAGFFQGTPCRSGDILYFPGHYEAGDVVKYEQGTWQRMNLPPAPYHYAVVLPNENALFISYLSAIICDPKGEVILAFDLETLKQQPICGVADKDEKIYIGGSYGVTLIEGDSIRLINNGIDETFRNIAKNQTGEIWVSTQNRLCRIEGDSIPTVYTFNDVIRSIHFTRKDILLVGTLKGIYIKWPEGDDFIYYDHHNGFTGEKLIRGNMCEDEAGNVWLISSKRLTRFNPGELLKKQSAPLLHLLSMQSSTDNIRWKSVEMNDMERLGHKNKNIKFSYVGLCYAAAQNIRYQYRLLGFQNDWSAASPEKEAAFNNLLPGKYEFQLQADSGAEETKTAPITFAFEILPAFWQTWPFVLSVILLGIGAVIWISYAFFKRKREKEIQSLEREKRLNILKINSIRLRSIPHFNANVLSGIEYYVMNFSKEEANKYLSMYSSFTNITLKDVDKPARTLKEELHYIRLYLDMEKMRFLDKLDFEIAVSPEVDDAILLPNMILHTHCENAMKHGLRHKKGKGKVRILVDNQETGVLVAIEDDGIGRAAAETLSTKGNGEGLNILSQQIGLYNQSNVEKISQRIVDLFGENQHPCGTRIEIFIPYQYAYF